jgi:hypothetical protein
MQERKNKRLFIMFVVLCVATVAVLWARKEDEGFAVDKHIFGIPELRNVDRVLLESQGDTVALYYSGGRWKVDTEAADPALIEVLFATLQQVQPKRPIAKSLQNDLLAQLQQQGVRVTLYTGKETVQRFFAGGNDSKTQSYFVKEGEETVYLVVIPGYRVYVSGIFELPERGWRDKTVFGFNWRNFRELKASFSRPGQDFTVAMDGQVFGIAELHETDTARLNDFLDAVSLLTVDEYLPATEKLDSLGKTRPVAKFTIRDVAGKEYTLSLFPDDRNRQFYGLVHNTQWALFQARKVQPVLRPKEFFEKR